MAGGKRKVETGEKKKITFLPWNRKWCVGVSVLSNETDKYENTKFQKNFKDMFLNHKQSKVGNFPAKGKVSFTKWHFPLPRWK